MTTDDKSIHFAIPFTQVQGGWFLPIQTNEAFRRLSTRIADRSRCWLCRLSLAVGMLCGTFAVTPASHAAGIGDFGGEPVRACLANYGRVILTEFYNEHLRHFFYAEPCFKDEEVILSGAAGPGWRKTGWEFGVWHFMSTIGTVCRFYGSVWPGPNSHFFTSDWWECNALRSLPSESPSQPHWNLEHERAFSVIRLLPFGGGCEPRSDQSGPVVGKMMRRFYNNGHAMGRDSNHRFVSDDEVELRNEMLRAGWVDEGVRFCVTGVYFNAVKRP